MAKFSLAGVGLAAATLGTAAVSGMVVVDSVQREQRMCHDMADFGPDKIPPFNQPFSAGLDYEPYLGGFDTVGEVVTLCREQHYITVSRFGAAQSILSLVELAESQGGNFGVSEELRKDATGVVKQTPPGKGFQPR